jgi:hypothetical protein
MPEEVKPDERRSHPRYKCVKPVEVTVVRKTVKGVSIDIGEGGISLYSIRWWLQVQLAWR